MSRVDVSAVRSIPISSVVGGSVQLKRRGNHLMGCCPFHPDSTPSLSVSDDVGLFHCFGCQASGDAIAFVMRLEGIPFAQAVQRIQDGFGTAPLPIAPVRKEQNESMRNAASTIWQNAGSVDGTPAARYLERRGLLLDPLLPLPALRFARLSYRGSYQKHPTLVAAVTDADDRLRGIQRIFLTEDGQKLDVDEPKLSLGNIKGNAIRIGSPAEELIVCEGLEDGLSVRLKVPNVPVWVAAGAGMMAHMKLPEKCRVVTIAADGDEAGRRAADAAASAFRQQGKSARIMRPSPQFKDFNEQLIESVA